MMTFYLSVDVGFLTKILWVEPEVLLQLLLHMSKMGREVN